jgi:hypothetical protein
MCHSVADGKKERETTASPSAKLDELMQQLADLKTSHAQAHKDMQHRLEMQEQLYPKRRGTEIPR